MKSFKEFLMEEDEQNINDQDFEILNSLKDFLENFDTKKDDNIDQEKIIKYLICKSIIKTNNKGEDLFSLKIKDSNESLQKLKEECQKLFNIDNEESANSELANKLSSIDNYIG